VPTQQERDKTILDLTRRLKQLEERLQVNSNADDDLIMTTAEPTRASPGTADAFSGSRNAAPEPVSLPSNGITGNAVGTLSSGLPNVAAPDPVSLASNNRLLPALFASLWPPL